jgi:hypothetical protein
MIPVLLCRSLVGIRGGERRSTPMLSGDRPGNEYIYLLLLIWWDRRIIACGKQFIHLINIMLRGKLPRLDPHNNTAGMNRSPPPSSLTAPRIPLLTHRNTVASVTCKNSATSDTVSICSRFHKFCGRLRNMFCGISMCLTPICREWACCALNRSFRS